MKKILSILVLVILMVLTASTTVGATTFIDASDTNYVDDQTIYYFSIKTADGGDKDPEGKIMVTFFGDRNLVTKDGESIKLPKTPPIKRGELMDYKLRISRLGNVTGMAVSYSHGHLSSQYDWNVEYIEFMGRRFMVNSTLRDETATIEFYPSGYTVTIKPGANRIPGRFGSIFSSPAIWFIIGGGVLILVAGALITIFALRKKKAKLALLATNASTVDTPINDSSEDAPISDSSEDKLNL